MDVSGFLDMELTSWLLLFLSRILDTNFEKENCLLVNRWDFLSSAAHICKKKVRCTFLRSYQVLRIR